MELCIIANFMTLFHAGMKHVFCGLYSAMFKAGSVIASVDIPLMDDEVSECDEEFTAHIVIGEGNSSSNGFKLGTMSSALITVKDNEGNYGHFISSCSTLV